VPHGHLVADDVRREFVVACTTEMSWTLLTRARRGWASRRRGAPRRTRPSLGPSTTSPRTARRRRRTRPRRGSGVRLEGPHEPRARRRSRAHHGQRDAARPSGPRRAPGAWTDSTRPSSECLLARATSATTTAPARPRSGRAARWTISLRRVRPTTVSAPGAARALDEHLDAGAHQGREVRAGEGLGDLEERERAALLLGLGDVVAELAARACAAAGST
jgi:hypothetical protein